MFGILVRNHKIIEGIKQEEPLFVNKFIKKFKKEIFNSIEDGDKDYGFSNIVINIIAYINTNDQINLVDVVSKYIQKYNEGKLKLKSVAIYNDRDLLKYIVKHWAHKEHRECEYCEVFNSVAESQIINTGNAVCYSMLMVNKDRIHIKQYSNDFSVFYQEDFEYYNSDFEHVDHIEFKSNSNDQITEENIYFKDGFKSIMMAQTEQDSSNINRFKYIVEQFKVATI